jgi:hypothetical protein
VHHFSQFLRYFTMASDYFEQAKNYAPEIREMIEPNLIYEENPDRRIALVPISRIWILARKFLCQFH